MSKYYYEGTDAVKAVKIASAVFAWLFLIVGVVMLFYGIADIEDSIVITGVTLVGVSISLFITKGLAKGFQSVVKASETYIKEVEEREAQKAKEEDKTIRVPMQ